jgi:ABC-type polysaccharide/polyol phosphate transport system ATPase subunit
MKLVEVSHVSRWFRRHTGRRLARDHFWAWIRRVDKQEQRFYALHDVSFSIHKGESVALVGNNGAGKSTLLSLIAGLTAPDEGHLAVHGTVAALMELGSGFHYDLTGAENLMLNASLIGLTEKRTRALFDSIVEFSGLSEFIDEPLRTYSAGMVMRLAFSVAVNMEADILIIDEVLTVGDQDFQDKCLQRLGERRRAGQTLLFVSHSGDLIRAFCDRALWLDRGHLRLDEGAASVLDAYRLHSHPLPLETGERR